MNKQYIETLIGDLISKGGAIVLSSECSEAEIAIARAEGRFAVLPTFTQANGLGFGIVRRPQEWLEKIKKKPGK